MAIETPEPAETPVRNPLTRRRNIGLTFLATTLVGAVGMALIPAPYVVEMPGPVYDTLSTVQDTAGNEVPLIEIDGADTYPTEGTLSLLTVYVGGSPDDHPSWLDVVSAWFRPDYAVIPMDLIYAPGTTHQDEVDASAIQMTNSQQEAVAAALTSLGIDFDSQIIVEEPMSGYPADGKLEKGDIILSANGVAVENVSDLRALIKDVGIGGTIDIAFIRANVERSVTLDIVAGEQDPSAAVIGVYTSGKYIFPFDVSIQLSNVGGSSAGMMFALGIIDELTPGALNGGAKVAGTGEITAAGEVGPIGGIVQKAYAARDSGAEWLLVPTSNCDDLYGHVPSGIREIPVNTLDDALAALKAISGGTAESSLPHCPAP
ncbi:MAG: PDZ domain-containing protein [Microbacteriaceae bacterium]